MTVISKDVTRQSVRSAGVGNVKFHREAMQSAKDDGDDRKTKIHKVQVHVG
jgi:hypothetical protein